jgi:hypothetical protein
MSDLNNPTTLSGRSNNGFGLAHLIGERFFDEKRSASGQCRDGNALVIDRWHRADNGVTGIYCGFGSLERCGVVSVGQGFGLIAIRVINAHKLAPWMRRDLGSVIAGEDTGAKNADF